MTTLEMLLALTIIILAISVAIVSTFGSQSLILDGQMSLQALYKAQVQLEQARANARSNWDTVASSSKNDVLFTESIDVKDAGEFLKSILSQVNWQISGQNRNVQLSTMLFDEDDASAQGSCANTASGDWTSPQNLSVALNTTGSATSVDVKSGIAYITANGNSTQADFFAVNAAANPPQILWSLNTGPGLIGVKVSGNYAYVANSSINSQLQIINLTARTFVGFKLPGSSTGDTANTLYYLNHKVFLGIPKSSIEEFYIIDVQDLSNVHEIGKFELNTGINAIYVSNNVAYIATPDNQELKMLDVHDPSHIILIGGYDAPGGSGNGKSFARKAQRLFLGRTVGNDELYVLHINDIASGGKASAHINSSVNGLTTIGNLVFLATTDLAKEFQVWQVADDDSSFNFQSSIDLPAKATAVDCEGQTVYVTTEDPVHGLSIITGN